MLNGNSDGRFNDDDLKLTTETGDCKTTALLQKELLSETDLSHVNCRHQIQRLENRIAFLERQNQELQNENVRLNQRCLRQLESFGSMVHELRTPLNCIVGLTELLLPSNSEDQASESCTQDILSEDQLESIQLIASSCGLLRSVVDDVLDLTKLETRTIHVDLQPVQVYNIVKNVVDTCAIHAKKTRNVSIRTMFNYHSQCPLILQTDSRLILQILFNLLSNAIKFSYISGTIDVTVSVKLRKDVRSSSQYPVQSYLKMKADQEMLCISVKDYGKGIEKDDIHRIFQPFQQAPKKIECTDDPNDENSKSLNDSVNDTSLYESEKGTGLGLTITSKIVESLRGILTVDSEVGQWSEFSVLLPISTQELQSDLDQSFSFHDSFSSLGSKFQDLNLNRQTKGLDGIQKIDESLHREMISISPPCSSLATTVSMETNFDKSKCQVLIAEDNKINQKVLQRVLQRLGIQNIDIVDDGKQAVEMTFKKEYDVIFMDIEMPIMDGMEATRLILERYNNNFNFSSHKITAKPSTRISTQAETDDNNFLKSTLESRYDSNEFDKHKKPKVIIISAHASVSFKQKTKDIGGDGFITKPFKILEIQNVFRTL